MIKILILILFSMKRVERGLEKKGREMEVHSKKKKNHHDFNGKRL